MASIWFKRVKSMSRIARSVPLYRQQFLRLRNFTSYPGLQGRWHEFQKGVGMWATSQPFYRSYSFFGSLENTKIQVLALLRLWPSKDCTESCFIESKVKKGQVICQEPILTVKYGWTFLEDFECHPCWNALNGVSKTLSEIASLRLFLRS